MKFDKTMLKRLIIFICLVIVFYLPKYVEGKNLTYAEYFIDTDPGQGNGTKINIPCDGAFNEAEEEFCVNNISVPPLSEGRHTFFLRLKDSENKWGMRRLDFYVVSSSPYVSKIITGAEYSIDSGSAVPLPSADGSFDESVEFLLALGIESSALTPGSHSLSVRVKDSYNVWSIARKVNFKVIEASPYKILDTAEYFIDTDPGVGHGSPLTADDGAFDESAEDAHKNNISTSTLSLGGHLVSVRFKDNWSYWPTFNGWGPTKLDTLCVSDTAHLISPPNGSSGPCNQTFKWSHLTGVVSYRLQIDTVESFPNPIRDLSVTVETCRVTGLPGGIPLWWRVRGNYPCEGVWSNIFEYTEVNEENQTTDLPNSFSLSHNYPNPFNPETRIDYALPRGCNVKLIIYNILGQKVKTLVDEFQIAGFKTVRWNGRDDQRQECGSGIYFYRLEAGEFSQTNKMILLK